MYVSELWRKKQSDLMRFLQRMRCWEYRQHPSIWRVTRPTPFLLHGNRILIVLPMLHVRRGGCTRPVPKGIVYEKPKNQGITQIKFHRNKRSFRGMHLDVNGWSQRLYLLILRDHSCGSLCIMLSRNDPRINHVHKHRELRGLTSFGKNTSRGHLNTKARPSRRETWKRNNIDSPSLPLDLSCYIILFLNLEA
ncbi:hypothetical protein MKW92_044905 [Papaver armeniacum]|nr:hypothetical protein MKW92_044905 [Papaver armeniacum]